MSGHVRWADIRAEYVQRAGGEAAVEAGKEELLAQVVGHRLAEVRRSRGFTQQQIALVTTFVGLLVTTWLTSGLVITGATTWVIATLIVWLFGVIAVLLLPLVIFKKALARRADQGPSIPPMR